MARYVSFLCAFMFLCMGSCFGETIVWSGEVQADGAPSPIVALEIGKRYQIRASGTMDLGRWWQQGKPLKNDACYGYNDVVGPEPIESLKDSINIGVSDGKYHPDHVYHSEPFIAQESGVHFWIHDINYNDNKGSLTVEVLQLPAQESN